MSTVITYNDNVAPHTLYETVGKEISLGAGNATGEDTKDMVAFPPVVEIQLDWPVDGFVNQILGLVPLKPCTDDECRDYTESKYMIDVFAEYGANTDVYKNDSSTFLISFDGWYATAYTTEITLEEYVGGSWITQAILNDDTYGTLIEYNDDIDQPSFAGYIISWHNVLNLITPGVFRIKFTITGGHLDVCAVSEAFCLREWTCTNVENTVKFEVTLDGGLVGHATNPAILVDLCGYTYTDSIRFEGFFGYERAEYERKNVEYNNGVIYKVRDEAIKKFDLQTGRLPKWLHDRFKAYALMADTLLVSDYNVNNPDYSIKRKGVVCDGGYEPVWVQNSRMARVRVQFKENQQNLIRKRCCDVKR